MTLSTRGPQPSTDPATPGMGPWRWALVGVVAVTGVAATLVTHQQAEAEARARQRALVTEVSVLVDSTAARAVVAMAGAGGLVTSNAEIELDSFRAYAQEVVRSSPLETLGYVPVVTAEERSSFEARIGGPILDRVGDDFVTAPQRPVHYPVLSIFPEREPTRAVVGFDILADPERGDAALEARDTGRTVLTEPVRAASDNAVGFFLAKPLYRPGTVLDTPDRRREAHIGFLTTVFAGADLTRAVLAEVPDGSRFSLEDGNELLAASEERPEGGTTRTLEVNGRSWLLQIEDGRATDRALELSVAAFATLLVAGLLLFFRRAEAHDAAARRSGRVIGRTADVAQALAAAGTAEAVDAVIQQQLPRVLGATAASIGLVDRDAAVLRLRGSPELEPDVAGRCVEVALDQRVPIAEVVRTGEPLLLGSLEDWRDHTSEEVMADVRRAGFVSTACIPLEDRHGQVTAALAISWDHEVAFDEQTRDTLRTLTELCEYTLDRARSTDQAARQASQLAQLAGKLAAAIAVADVLDILVEAGASPIDATATIVGILDRDAAVLHAHHGPHVSDEVRQHYQDVPLDTSLAFTDAARTGEPVLLVDYDAFTIRYPASASSTTTLGLGARAALPLRGSDGSVLGSIVHAWPGPRLFDETLVSTLMTIADMAGQALERTGLSEAEHRLVTTLQDSVLVSMPVADDLDIASRYLPAAQDVGMGGDWYEGIALGGHRYALIVGDVAGHGITAVGVMAQLRAVLGTLVRLGSSSDEVFAQTTALLQAAAHHPTATALLVLVDTASGNLTYAAAGHPPPLVRTDGTCHVLDEGRQPLLGIPVSDGGAATAAFPPGSVLVAYTDGLIEVRGESIDVSVDRLCATVEAAPRDLDAEALADHLLDACLQGREPDDDVALVVIAHRR